MLDVRWLAKIALSIAAIAAMPAGALEAVLAAINGPATVSEWADRGEQTTIGQPPQPTSTSYVLPVADVDRASWSATHSTYPATDIFVGCGATLVAPVSGTVLEVRRVNSYDPVVDDPATRGGRSVSILGHDGVRYYLAHFDTIVDGLAPDDMVAAGQRLGTMGDSGRTAACHLHFSISPPCPGQEWAVRRGVIWPYRYLDAWRRGEQLSPVAEADAWTAANPQACAEAMADPFAGNA